MAKKKAARRKTKKRRKTRRKKTQLASWKKIFLAISVLTAVAGVGFFVYSLQKSGRLKLPRLRVEKAQKTGQPLKAKPTFEIYPKKDIPLRQPLPKPKADTLGRKPKVAIIIDDLGHDFRMAKKFFNLNNNLTFSILPYTAFHRKVAQQAYARSLETMLHLPMEPLEYPAVDPGGGALLTSMSPDQLIAQLNANLDAVPHIKGVNNHMGSRMTTVSTQLYQIFSILKKRDLFFIDSRTTDESLCKPSARLFRVPFAQRDVFIDNVQKTEALRRQIKKLVLIAKSHGEAIGIAHPYQVTYKVLQRELPKIEAELELVPASKLAHTDG
jgi:polysaccharide deacetylase 2 family uncharacterized protein YibQ